MRNQCEVQAKQKKGKETIKYIFLAFLLFFLFGIIVSNLCQKEADEGIILWNMFAIENLKYMEISHQELFFFIVKCRLPVLEILLLFSVTGLSFWVLGFFLVWQGFSFGFLITNAVGIYGLKGIGLILAAILPQYLLYGTVYAALLFMAVYWKQGQKRRQEKIYLLMVMFLLNTTYILGIFIESYFNPFLLEKVLRFF